MSKFWKLAVVLPALLAPGSTQAAGLLGDLLDISGNGIGVNVPGVAEVGVNLGGGIGVDAEVLPGVGGGVTADVGIGTKPNTGAITVDANVLPNVGGGVGTNVWVGGTGNGGLGVTANVNALPAAPTGGLNTNAQVCIGPCGINANVDLGLLPGLPGGGLGVDLDLCIGNKCGTATNVPPKPDWPNQPPQLPPTPPTYTGSKPVGMIDRIIRNQGWSRFVRANAVCLPVLRLALVRNWLPGQDVPDLQNLATYHSAEIRRLRALLAACPGNRLSAADLNRVVAVDVMADGSPVILIF